MLKGLTAEPDLESSSCEKVGRVAWCELDVLRPSYDDFRLTEFAVLDEGSRLMVRDDCVFSQATDDPLVRSEVENGVWNALLPDEPLHSGESVPVDVAWYLPEGKRRMLPNTLCC